MGEVLLQAPSLGNVYILFVSSLGLFLPMLLLESLGILGINVLDIVALLFLVLFENLTLFS